VPSAVSVSLNIRLYAARTFTDQSGTEKDPSGYITLQGKQTLELIFGSCGGTLFNKLATRARINEATLAVEMTDKIYNQCVIKGMWGRWETDQYSIRIYYVDRNLSRSRSRHSEGSENRLATPAKPKQKRDAAGTTCIEYQQPGPPPPVPEECRSAIDGLTSMCPCSFPLPCQEENDMLTI
jgi:hypothetical protein